MADAQEAASTERTQIERALLDQCQACGASLDPRDTNRPDFKCVSCRNPPDPRRGVRCKHCGELVLPGQAFPVDDEYYHWECGKMVHPESNDARLEDERDNEGFGSEFD